MSPVLTDPRQKVTTEEVIVFLVETGSVVPDANAYIAVAYADTYHLDRGHGSWTPLSTGVKQSAIIRATDYVDKRFGRRFRGRRVSPQTQPLEWPRLAAFDKDKFLICNSGEIPKNLMQAVAEYALRAALAGELSPDAVPNVPRQDLTTAGATLPTEFQGGQVRRVQEQVDVILTSTTYNTPDNLTVVSRPKTILSGLVTDANIPEYPVADMLMDRLLENGRRNLRRG